ncbi:unnamed protein product [Schistosoma margrebowiei]|uniref:Uncharacterized protein n=1 Tax=Schistosoma margrebowiei TaxID=48269 RepID=A0A183LUT1_9TREM|nr:unnamed protein product [Schistosoma margrebowiei]
MHTHKHIRLPPSTKWLSERFHCQLKSALRTHENGNWQETLPFVLLGIRTSLKGDIQCSAAELVYGTALRLPGEFFTPRSRPNFGKSDYVHRLSAFMRTLSPVSTRIQHRQVTLPRELSTCTRVFIRVDSVRKPLQRPYESSFHMIARHEKTFEVDRYSPVKIVSIDRLKPAHVDDSALGILKSSSDPTLDTSKTSFSRPVQQHASSALSTDEATVSRSDQQITPPLTSDEIAGSLDTNETTVSRSGRRVRLPVRFRDQSHSQQPIRFHAFDHLRLVPSTSVKFGESWPDHPRSCQHTQSIFSFRIFGKRLASNFVVMVASASSVQRGFVLRLQRFLSDPDSYERNLQILDTNHSCGMPVQARNTAYRSWYRSPKTTSVGN